MPIPIYYNNEPYVPSPLAPEGVPTVADTATMEDLTPAGRELLERYRKSAKERAKREELAQRGYTTIIEEDGKEYHIRSEPPLQSEDYLFALGLAGGVGTAQAAQTMGWIPAIASDIGGTVVGSAGSAGGYKLGSYIDNKYETHTTPYLTFFGGLGGGVSGGILGYKGAVAGSKYLVDNGIRGYSDFKPIIQDQLLIVPKTTQEPLLNVGWAPAQTIDVRRAGELTEMYYPNRWDVVEEGANPFGVWLQGKFGTPRTNVTNPGKGGRAAKARELFANRPQYVGNVTLKKPIQTIGEVPDRSSLSYDAERMGADGIVYNGIYDNGYNNNQVIFSFNEPHIK